MPPTLLETDVVTRHDSTNGRAGFPQTIQWPAVERMPFDEGLEPPDDLSDQSYEVVRGVYTEKPMSARSQWIGQQIHRSMEAHVTTNRLGMSLFEANIILDRRLKHRRKPDVSFISAARWPLDRVIPYDDDYEVIPDLAIEVASKKYTLDEVLAKVTQYLHYGVRQVWQIIPNEELAYVYTARTRVLILTPDTPLSAEELIPGWSLSLDELFRAVTPISGNGGVS